MPGQGTETPLEILVEVRPNTLPGDLAPKGEMLEDFRKRADEITNAVAELAGSFRSKLGKLLDDEPSDRSYLLQSVEIEFELTFQAEAGILIARAAAGATFTARLTLSPPKED
jgi:hypothetical protein